MFYNIFFLLFENASYDIILNRVGECGMGVLDKYFAFKKRNLVSYALLFLEDKEKKTAEPYLKAYVDTYINTFYYHVLDTYYDHEITNFNNKITIKELQGKRLELLADNGTDRSSITLINRCYSTVFISIIIDTMDFYYCARLNDFRVLLRKTLEGFFPNDDVVESLSLQVRDDVLNERKFFVTLKNDTFAIHYYPYLVGHRYSKVALDYSIGSLERNYTRIVLDKNYQNTAISYAKLKATLDLLGADLLNRILENMEIGYYFVELPLTGINKKDVLEELIQPFDNPRVKNHVIFVIQYEDYISNKSKFKNLTSFTFALEVNLSRVIMLEKRFDEIASFDLFHYVILDGVKKEDYHLVENYVLPGKEIFMNELTVM